MILKCFENAEYLCLGESILERQAKMRERAKELSRKREAERQLIVEAKLEDKWKSECSELRSVLSRRNQDQVCAARKYQIETKAMIKQEEVMENQLYAK